MSELQIGAGDPLEKDSVGTLRAEAEKMARDVVDAALPMTQRNVNILADALVAFTQQRAERYGKCTNCSAYNGAVEGRSRARCGSCGRWIEDTGMFAPDRD